MDKNIRIAKQLLKVAKSLLANNDDEKDFNDFLKKVRYDISNCISVNSVTRDKATATANFSDVKMTVNEKEVNCEFILSSENDGENESDLRLWLNYYFKVDGALFDARVGISSTVGFSYDKGKKVFSFSKEDDAKKFVADMQEIAIREFDHNSKVDHCLGDLKGYLFGEA